MNGGGWRGFADETRRGRVPERIGDQAVAEVEMGRSGGGKSDEYTSFIFIFLFHVKGQPLVSSTALHLQDYGIVRLDLGESLAECG
jgi:hypothetical protein